MRATDGIDWLPDGSWDCGSTRTKWSPDGCARGSVESCSCSASCGCNGEGGGSCDGGKPSGDLPLLPDYGGEIWASPERFIVDSTAGGHSSECISGFCFFSSDGSSQEVPAPGDPWGPSVTTTTTAYPDPVIEQKDICGPDVTDWLMVHLDNMRRKARLWAGTKNLAQRTVLVAGAAVTDGEGNLNFGKNLESPSCPKGKCANTVMICGTCFNNDVPEDLTFGTLYSNAQVPRAAAHAGAHTFATASSVATSVVAVVTLGGVYDVEISVGDHEGAYPVWVTGESFTAEDLQKKNKKKFCDKIDALAKKKNQGVTTHPNCAACQDPPKK